MNIKKILDFIILVLSIDLLHMLAAIPIFMMLGAETNEDTLKSISFVLSLVTTWMKVGLAIFFVKKLPLRRGDDSSIEFRKLWVMFLAWPLLLKT